MFVKRDKYLIGKPIDAEEIFFISKNYTIFFLYHASLSKFKLFVRQALIKFSYCNLISLSKNRTRKNYIK